MDTEKTAENPLGMRST